MKNLKEIIQSTILCIRFPFLYPRNRFTLKHYTNWKILSKISDVYKKYSTTDDKFKRHYTKWWALPYIYLLKAYHHFLSIFHFLPWFTELNFYKNEAPGWYNRFGIKLCKDIRKQLIKEYFQRFPKHPFDIPLFKLRILQWKEKFGRMELYVMNCSSQIRRIIADYSKKSETICVSCGKDADVITAGYILPFCKECFEKQNYRGYLFKNENGIWLTKEE